MLGLLTEGDCSGYELQAAARRGVGYVWTAAKSQVYTVLPRLVEGGYATSRHVAQKRLPDKQVYRITARGRRALRSWLEEPVEDFDGPRSPFLLKVFFGGEMSAGALVRQIEGLRAHMSATHSEYRAIEERIAADPDDYYGYLTLRWGLARSQAAIAWADEVLAELRERP